jgi:hypothetical protein
MIYINKKKIKLFIKKHFSRTIISYFKRFYYYILKFNTIIRTIVARFFLNRLNLLKNRSKNERYLEIGVGNYRFPKFETLNIVWSPNVDYVYDASRPLPFKDNTFKVIYASHVLEHIPWYQTREVLRE